jgi:hypothetical protein
VIGPRPTPGRRAFLASLLPILAVAQGCATARSPSVRTSPLDAVPGYRAYFKGLATGPQGKARFRMAAALVEPDLLRLEFFGPVGGARLVTALDGLQAVAIVPGERVYDRGPAEAATLDRILGLPLSGAQTIALLTGRPMCEADSSEQRVLTKAAVTFGRTVSWYEITCPPGDIRYQARATERGGILTAATVREGISGDMILEVGYEDHEEGLGPRWPRRIRIHLARRDVTVELVAIEGPDRGDLSRSVFSPSIPDGFEKRPLLTTLPAPGLLGSAAGWEK